MRSEDLEILTDQSDVTVATGGEGGPNQGLEVAREPAPLLDLLSHPPQSRLEQQSNYNLVLYKDSVSTVKLESSTLQ